MLGLKACATTAWHHLYFFIQQEALSNMDDYDKTCLESALVGVCNIVQQEWGGAIPCQVMVDSFSSP
jgi:hypothetical protein